MKGNDFGLEQKLLLLSSTVVSSFYNIELQFAFLGIINAINFLNEK